MPPKVDPDLCDEFAYTLLSYESMAEVVSSRYDCPEIKGFYYRGTFEDDVDLLIGPDYSILLTDPTVNLDVHIDAYLCGFRTPLTNLKTSGINPTEEFWKTDSFWKLEEQ